ncbi:MAG: hypothetical protein Q9218_006840 [Villophora microphyllina]
MALPWQKSKGRRMGLRKENLGYHLHENLPGPAHSSSPRRDDNRRVRESTVDIYAQPKSDSSKEASPTTASVSSEADTPPPAKRRKREPLISEQVDLTSPAPRKRSPTSSDRSMTKPSNIRPTLFTSSGHPSSQPSATGKGSFHSSQGSQVDRNNDDFAHYRSSQSKSARTYGSRQAPTNFHRAELARPEKKRVKNEPEKAEQLVKTGTNGFKTVDDEVVRSLARSPKKERKGNFKEPPSAPTNPKATRASRRILHKSEDAAKADHPKVFKRPPQPPSPEHSKLSPPKFVVPQGISPQSKARRSSRSNQSSQDTSVPIFPNLQKLQEIRGLADTVQAKLQVQLEPPASSATVSSGPSFEFEDGSSSSSLSSAPDVQEIDGLEHGWPENHPPSSPQKQCPICKSDISRLFMEEFFGSEPLSLREQVQFCKAHKIRSAEKLWRKRGYPTIEWHRFARRLPRYEDKIVEILNGSRRSFYRNAFEDQVRSGMNRTLQQSMMSGSGWEGLNVGYYGTKGARILMDYTMSKFASRIRRLASIDRLVSAGGVSGFVQAVLAPELAVMLVKDDMKVEEEQAREILKESSEVGNLLNEEEDEIIKDELEMDVGGEQ